MLDFIKNSFEKIPLSQEQKEIFNPANCLSMLRIGVIPILFLLLLSPGKILSLVIAFFFIIAAITDLLDGYIARKYNLVTTLGKFLDPVADKLIVSAAMILMIPIGWIPAWMVVIIVMRDLMVDGLRSVASAEGIVIQAGVLGKQKTVSLDIAISALLIHYPLFGADAYAVGMAVMYLALVLALWSGVDYFIKFHRGAFKK